MYSRNCNRTSGLRETLILRTPGDTNSQLYSTSYFDDIPGFIDITKDGGLDAGTYEICYKPNFLAGDVKDFTILIDAPV